MFRSRVRVALRRPAFNRLADGLQNGFVALRHRNYRIFWFGQLSSLTGNWMQSVALAWLVLLLTDSAFQLGLVTACQFGPVLVLGPIGGVVADRIPKRSLLLATQSVAALLAASLAALVATGAAQLWHIYAVAIGFGIVNAFDMPTRQAFITEMVGKDDLMNAIALNSVLFNVSRIVGPAAAGFVIDLVGAAAAFAVNAASYVPVIVGLLLMRIAPTVAAAEGSGADRLRQGLAYVRATPPVLLTIALVGLVGTFAINWSVWIPLLARRDLDIGASGYGLLMSAMGVGSLIGALALAFGSGGPRPGLMIGTMIAFGALEILLALAGAVPVPVAVAMLVLAAMGFAMSTAMATANTFVQTHSPDELRGRVMSLYMTVFVGTTPIGALVAGTTARLFGTPASLAIGGGVALLAAAGIGIRLLGTEASPAQAPTSAPSAGTAPSGRGPRAHSRPAD